MRDPLLKKLFYTILFVLVNIVVMIIILKNNSTVLNSVY